MPLESDLTINASKFSPESIAESTKQANALLANITANAPKWYEVGSAQYREMQLSGKTPLPPPVYLPNAIETTVPSRDALRQIPVRVYKPDHEPSKGVFLHAHGGGWVLGSHDHQDRSLQMFANGTGLTTVSVGYRLAPENPYPAAISDCIDVAEYLVDDPSRYGSVRFLGGESAGAYLALLSAFHLLRTRPSHTISGVVLRYGEYDLAVGLPAIVKSASTKALMIDRYAMERFNSAYLPNLSIEERRDPSLSPLYEDVAALAAATPNGLPPALFVCGTADPLLDDTLLMGMKWSIAGGESIVKVFPGAAHGFTVIPGLPVAEEANAVSVQFMREKLAV
ncbi:Alpha/Beta hydrolase protein [Aspergillus pseudodeflectus]|uniref:Alpha/Beta hydrolase protein n=1 Tax=Aspergillus pseudodeflectus TaxID=176178 RepID=A0ABR4KLP5_9EURO